MGGHLVALWTVALLLPAAPRPQSPSPAASPQAEEAAKLSPEDLKARERMALIAVSTVLHGERSYAAANGSLFDQIGCLTQPVDCIPGFPPDSAPFLDPTYEWLQPKLGYVRAFHAGPKASAEEVATAKASPSSLKAFAFTATPLRPGETGIRAFCGDSSGRMCVTPKGTEPPVKDGRCEPCQKLQ